MSQNVISKSNVDKRNVGKAIPLLYILEPGRPGWLGFRDLASPLFSFQKLQCVLMTRRAGPVTEISVTKLEIFPI